MQPLNIIHSVKFKLSNKCNLQLGSDHCSVAMLYKIQMYFKVVIKYSR